MTFLRFRGEMGRTRQGGEKGQDDLGVRRGTGEAGRPGGGGKVQGRRAEEDASLPLSLRGRGGVATGISPRVPAPERPHGPAEAAGRAGEGARGVLKIVPFAFLQLSFSAPREPEAPRLLFAQPRT